MKADGSALDGLRLALGRAARAFDARSRRERGLIALAVLALVLLAADALLLTPARRAAATAEARLKQTEAALQTLGAEVAKLQAQSAAEDKQARAELLSLRQRVQQSSAEMQQHQSTLVGARQMVPLLERMLAAHGGLRVRSLQAQGMPERVDLQAAAAPAPAATARAPDDPNAPALYRHAVELTLEGSYAELLAYLRALEAMPQRLLWSGMRLSAEQHPKLVLTLRVHTLGLDRSWLEI